MPLGFVMASADFGPEIATRAPASGPPVPLSTLPLMVPLDCAFCATMEAGFGAVAALTGPTENAAIITAASTRIRLVVIQPPHLGANIRKLFATGRTSHIDIRLKEMARGLTAGHWLMRPPVARVCGSYSGSFRRFAERAAPFRERGAASRAVPWLGTCSSAGAPRCRRTSTARSTSRCPYSSSSFR